MQERGFTLVEVVVTVAILAIAAGVAIPALSNLSRGELRKAARMLSGVVRETYDDASLAGKTHRMVFRFDKKEIGVESTDKSLNFDPESGAFVQASRGGNAAASVFDLAAKLGVPEEESKKDTDKDDEETSPKSALMALSDINKLAAPPNSFTQVRRFPLPDGVRVLDVWSEGMSQPVAEGEVSLVFFSHGYTQDALIHLEDDENRVFTVKVWALTGKTAVYESYIEAPK